MTGSSLLRPLRQWWTQSNLDALQKSQDKLLNTFVQTPWSKLATTAGVNSVEFVKQSSGGTKTVILLHGFGSGLGFFYNNVDLLMNDPDVHQILAVDWLGMGGSDRPSCRAAPIRFNSKCGWCDSDFTTTQQAVDFFIDPLHEWMQEHVNHSNKHITLVGHSLGGYLAARYAFKYDTDHKIQKLVLASPVGFPPKPPNTFVGAQLPTSLRVVDALWSRNVTPQQLIRMVGATRGRRNVQRALRARMPQLPESSVGVLADYLYHITVGDPSGEFAMNSLLEPVASPEVMGVFAREPLQHIMQEQRPGSVSSIKVLYGDQDWMRPNETSARESLKALQKTTDIVDADVAIVPRAGHHLYMENPKDFVRHIVCN